MKIFFGLSLIILTSFQFGLSSCTKDHTLYDTVTVTKVDTVTVVKSDTTISIQLLTANAWKLQELRGVKGDSIEFYVRGGISNSENFDAEYIKFNTDLSGTYVDGNSATHQVSWQFTDSSQITFVINNLSLPSQTVVYNNMRYKNNALLFDQYWTYGSTNEHSQVMRTKK